LVSSGYPAQSGSESMGNALACIPGVLAWSLSLESQKDARFRRFIKRRGKLFLERGGV
jgi:hypothetical protein